MRTATVGSNTPLTLTPESFEALGDAPIPTAPYFSPEYFEKERDEIFRKAWLCVGREQQVPTSGDYFTKDLPLFRTSLLVTRGRDGVVRGFHNVCSHRSNKLVWDDCGSARSLVCRFHGWAFQPDGDLRFVPEEQLFPPIDRKEAGLTPITTDTWHGFIFINMQSDPSLTLLEFLGELGTQLGDFPFDDMTQVSAFRTEINANWKLGIDAFLESYHVRFIHQNTVSPIVRNSTDDSSVDCYGFARLGPHARMTIPGVRPSKVSAMAALTMGLLADGSAALPGIDTPLPPGLNPAKGTNFGFDMPYVFPHEVWLLFPGSMAVYEFMPLGPEKTLWEARYYIAPAKDATARFAQEYNKIFVRDTLLEDAATLEHSQSVMASGAKKHMILGDQELLLRHFHHTIDSFVNGTESLT